MTGYLFIAVYTDVNGYSGEWLYYYLTFFINFICFLLFQQWFCLARSNVFITRTYVFYTHRFHTTYPHLHKTIFIEIPFSSTTSHISNTSSSPLTTLLFTSFTFYTFHISNMYILLIIMHSIFLHFYFFNDAYSKKQLLVYGHGAAIYPELRSDNFSLSLLPGTFPQQFPYCCIHLQPDG